MNVLLSLPNLDENTLAKILKFLAEEDFATDETAAGAQAKARLDEQNQVIIHFFKTL